MAYKNTAVTVCIMAWDIINGVGKTGDSANFTLRGVGDGSEFTPSSPSITQIDATNLPGVYSVALAASENNYSHVLLGGISSTSGIVIRPIQWTNETDANVAKWKTVVVPTPATAGIPDTNAKNINNVATTSVTTINANVGTTQPENFTGTGASALVKVDVTDIAAAAVSTASAQLGVNVVTNSDKTGYSLAAGQLFIKKNTALNNFPFVMRDSTTHAPKPALVVTGTRDIDGAGFAATANAVTEIGNGWYQINLAASDLNGTSIAFRFTAAAADDLDFTIITQT